MLGSSPHTWRILSMTTICSNVTRIISTYVENTVIGLCEMYQVKDHLHIRGEYSMLTVISQLLIGSSPHTWRILFKLFQLLLVRRIISTYVENTSLVAAKTAVASGSSPHTWRILYFFPCFHLSIRIISTYVENTYKKRMKN